MLRAYVSYGFDPGAFWCLSPREISDHIAGARMRLEAEQDGRAWLAWHIAALTRADELPELSELVGPRGGEVEAQSPDAQAVALDQMFLAWGASPEEVARMRAIGGGGA